MPIDPKAAAKLIAAMAVRNPSTEDYERQIAQVEAEGRIVLCSECHQVLTATEIVMYENRCDRCEGEWMEDVEAWRHGRPVAPERAAEFERMASSGGPSRSLQ